MFTCRAWGVATRSIRKVFTRHSARSRRFERVRPPRAHRRAPTAQPSNAPSLRQTRPLGGMAYAGDLKSLAGNSVRVRVPQGLLGLLLGVVENAQSRAG